MYTISLTALGSDFLISFRSDRKPIWKLTLSAHRVSLPVRFFRCGSFLCLCSPELFTSLFASSMVGLFPRCIGPRGFTFTWWGCCDHINQPSSPTPFYSVLVSISVLMVLSTVFHSLNSPDNSPLSCFVLWVLIQPNWSFHLSLIHI